MMFMWSAHKTTTAADYHWFGSFSEDTPLAVLSVGAFVEWSPFEVRRSTPPPPHPPPPSPQRVNWEHWPRNTMQRAFKFVCKPLKWRLNVACLTPSPATSRFLISFLWMSHSQQSPSQVFIQWHLLPLLLQRVLCLYVLSCVRVCSVEQEIHVYFVQ